MKRPGLLTPVTLVVVGTAALALPQQSREPRSIPGLFEVQGFDFRPFGGWRAEAARVRANRSALLRARDFAGLNRASRATSIGGTYTVPVLPIAFNNVPPPFPAQHYQQVLFSSPSTNGPYSVRTYYSEASRGRLTLNGQVLDWVVADSTDKYYEDGCNGIGVLTDCPHGALRMGELLIEGLQQNDHGSVDWGGFDNDGPDGLPNSGDDDGVVDFVVFLQPEVDGACHTDNLWAHRYDLAFWNGGSPYLTHSPRRDGAGQPIPNSYIQVRDYTLQSAVGGPSACEANSIMPIGTLAHETGHAFGLPDLYDTDFRSTRVTQGVGEWSIMGSGNYSMPYSPSAFDAWSLTELGWATIDTLQSDQVATLGPIATSDTVLLYPVPNSDEFFLFENRQALGSDSAQINPNCRNVTRSCAKGPGLLIWHIDQGQIDQHGFGRDNRVNTGPVQGVALVQADGLNELRTPAGKDRGDGGDPWPGSGGSTVFGLTTNPAAQDNQGRDAGLLLDQIQQLSTPGPVSFRFTIVPAGGVTLTLPWAVGALVGKGGLGRGQLDHLDSLGNRNGQYDVGDFLVYYRSQLPDLRRAGP